MIWNDPNIEYTNLDEANRKVWLEAAGITVEAKNAVYRDVPIWGDIRDSGPRSTLSRARWPQLSIRLPRRR